MKKIILLAALVVASTALYAAPGKKKKKEATAPKEQPVELISASDTLSYAAGKTLSRGLLEYLQQTMQVDTAYMADFVAGFKEAIEKGTDPQYNAYTAGRTIALQVEKQMLPGITKQFEGSEHTIDARLLHAGFLSTVLSDTTVMTPEHAAKIFKEMRQADEKKQNEAYRQKNEQWLKDNAKKEGVQTTPSGLQYKVITMGTGKKASATDNVTVKYEGKLIDGTVFDSSYKRNPQTIDFRPNQVIKGWTEALCMMPEGSKWELYIPQNLGYGEHGAGPTIKPFSTLIFTVEVVKVNEEPKADAAKTGTAAEKQTVPAAKLTPAKKTAAARKTAARKGARK